MSYPSFFIFSPFWAKNDSQSVCGSIRSRIFGSVSEPKSCDRIAR